LQCDSEHRLPEAVQHLRSVGTGTRETILDRRAGRGQRTDYGIAGTSAALTLKSGSHSFGATAQMADGTESDPNACTATALVKPGVPVSFTVSVQ